jgi:hypothetical protein
LGLFHLLQNPVVLSHNIARLSQVLAFQFRFEQGEDGDLVLKLFQLLENPVVMPHNIARLSQVLAYQFRCGRGWRQGFGTFYLALLGLKLY